MSISILFSTLLFFINPLEEIDISKITLPEIQITVINQEYIINTDFFVKNILEDDNGFSVVIVDNNLEEYVLTGMQLVYVTKNTKYLSGQKIGKDFSINKGTNFILIGYNNIKKFPQLINNKLYIKGDSGIQINAIADATVDEIRYIPSKGNYIHLKPINMPEINIEYWHLQSFRVIKGMSVKINTTVGYIGNMGVSYEPHLTLFIYSDDYFEDYKAIYIKIE